jgi:hypothetical protein
MLEIGAEITRIAHQNPPGRERAMPKRHIRATLCVSCMGGADQRNPSFKDLITHYDPFPPRIGAFLVRMAYFASLEEYMHTKRYK